MNFTEGKTIVCHQLPHIVDVTESVCLLSTTCTSQAPSTPSLSPSLSNWQLWGCWGAASLHKAQIRAEFVEQTLRPQLETESCLWSVTHACSRTHTLNKTFSDSHLENYPACLLPSGGKKTSLPAHCKSYVGFSSSRVNNSTANQEPYWVLY